MNEKDIPFLSATELAAQIRESKLQVTEQPHAPPRPFVDRKAHH